MDWLNANSHWLFEGIGTAALLAVVTWLTPFPKKVAGWWRAWRIERTSRKAEAPPLTKPVAINPDFAAWSDDCDAAAGGTSSLMTAGQVARYMCGKSQWGLGFENGSPGFAVNHPGRYLEREFQRVAKEGHFHVRGRKGGKGVHEPIPTEFWFMNTPNFKDTWPISKTRIAGWDREYNFDPVRHEQIPEYTDLVFERAEIYKVWPGCEPGAYEAKRALREEHMKAATAAAATASGKHV